MIPAIASAINTLEPSSFMTDLIFLNYLLFLSKNGVLFLSIIISGEYLKAN